MEQKLRHTKYDRIPHSHQLPYCQRRSGKKSPRATTFVQRFGRRHFYLGLMHPNTMHSCTNSQRWIYRNFIRKERSRVLHNRENRRRQCTDSPEGKTRGQPARVEIHSLIRNKEEFRMLRKPAPAKRKITTCGKPCHSFKKRRTLTYSKPGLTRSSSADQGS